MTSERLKNDILFCLENKDETDVGDWYSLIGERNLFADFGATLAFAKTLSAEGFPYVINVIDDLVYKRFQSKQLAQAFVGSFYRCTRNIGGENEHELTDYTEYFAELEQSVKDPSIWQAHLPKKQIKKYSTHPPVSVSYLKDQVINYYELNGLGEDGWAYYSTYAPLALTQKYKVTLSFVQQLDKKELELVSKVWDRVVSVEGFGTEELYDAFIAKIAFDTF